MPLPPEVAKGTTVLPARAVTFFSVGCLVDEGLDGYKNPPCTQSP